MKEIKMVVAAVFMLGALLLSFASAATAAPGSGPAAAEASFYKGKTVTFVVPTAPGGGYDAYARLISPYLAKSLEATVVVRNVPAAGFVEGHNFVYNAEPNGLTIGIINGVMQCVGQLLGYAETKRIDARRFSWIGVVASEPSVLVLSNKSPYRSLNDLKVAKSPIKFPATGVTTKEVPTQAILSEILGLNSKIILGFRGSKESSLAAIRGEVDAMTASASSVADFVKNPELTALCAVSRSRTSLFPGAPAITELLPLNPQQLKLLDLLEWIGQPERAIAAAPGVPAGRVQFLRSTLNKVLHDQGFLATAAKTQRIILYSTGEELAKNVSELLNMPESDIAKLKNTIEKYLVR